MVDLDSEQLGSIGEYDVASNFARIGWGPIPNEKHDRGTDFVMQVRDARGAELPVFVGVQAKAGDSQFAEKVRDDDGEITGWWFRDTAGHHMRRWLNHSVPFLIVLHEIGTRISHWEHITAGNVHWTGKGAKIFVPITNVVDETSRDRLMRVADAQRVGTTWEGSIWRAGADIAPPDLLRHALIAPRLIALHPNAGTETPPSPEQAIAMLMLARLDELNRHAQKHAEVPRLDAVLDDADWRWRFAAALNALVMRDDVGPVQERIADAPTRQARAAATVAAAARQIQGQRVNEALALLDDAIKRAEPRSVDAAWLKVQRGRALVQVGRPADALDDLLDAQSARLEVPGDVTATGIAGAAVTFLFNIGPWREKDLAALIEESDTATAWWRAQTTSFGLWKAADRAFDGWVRDRSIRIGGGDTANNQLVAASLMATHVGDHGGWAGLSAAVAKNTLIQLDRDADLGPVADALTSLRLAGDNKAVEAAARRAVADGPARAVTQAAKRIGLDLSTRSTALADLTLLEHGGDVLDAPTATRTVTWLLATLKSPEAFVTRTRPTYALVHQLTRTLASVLPAAAADDQRAVVRHLCDLDPVDHQLDANGWARVVEALPDLAWSDNDLASVAATADPHDAELRLALLGVAARRGANAARLALLAEAKAGSLDAVAALADVRDLPHDVVAAQIGRLAESVSAMVTAARGGKHGLANRDPAHALILFNVWHPDDAVWEPVLDLLQEPAVVASNKRPALRLLIQMTERIPEAVGGQLARIAASLARSSALGPLDIFGDGSVSGQAALLAVALDALSTEETAQHLIRLLSGDRADRMMAAALAGREPKADHTGILAALAGDEVPDVRATAAQGLARRLAGGDESVLLLQALRAGLDDPGTLMASAIAATLRDAAEPTALEFRERLRTHPSAYVRSLAPAAPSSHG